MTPTRMQYIFAEDWPIKVFIGMAAFLGLGAAVTACQPSVEMFRDWQFVLLFLVAITIAPILAFFVSIPLAFIFLGPIYQIRGKLNGAPFHVGDRVRILVSPHRDQVVQVYAIWESRHQVRVHLGERAKTEVKDVFSFTEVFREITD